MQLQGFLLTPIHSHELDILCVMLYCTYSSQTARINYCVAILARNCWCVWHRRLQSCVGTRAGLGYAVFDAQLRKAYFVTTLYAISTSVLRMHGIRVQFSWYEYT